MRKTNMLYVLMSFLAFSVLFGSFYFIIEDEIILGAILAAVSLASIAAIFFLLRKQADKETTQTDTEEIHYLKPTVKKESTEKVNDKTPEELETQKEEPEPIIHEASDLEEISEEIHKHDDIYDFDVIVNENFEDNMMSFIEKMVDQNMFLESFDYQFSPEEIRENDLEGQKLYKYEFHPIPLISLIRDFKNTDTIKVMIGMNSKDMLHIGYVPQEDIDIIKENYSQIKNIKAHLSGGIYHVLEEKSTMIKEHTDPFVIKLSIYQ